MGLRQPFEHAGAGRGHLGIGAGGDDGGHDVPPEGRPGLEQKALVGVDGKGRAVRGEAGFQSRRHLGDEGPAQVGGPGQDDFGLILPGDFRQGRGVMGLPQNRRGAGLRPYRPCRRRRPGALGPGAPPLSPTSTAATPTFSSPANRRASPSNSRATGASLPWRCSAKTQTPSGGTPGRGAGPAISGRFQGPLGADFHAGPAQSAALADDQGVAFEG
jgi:hypothetical protein